MYNEIIVIVERTFDFSDPDLCKRYIGAPCHTFEEARELVYAHRRRGCDFFTSYVNNGTDYAEIDAETGEVVAEYYVRLIGHD